MGGRLRYACAAGAAGASSTDDLALPQRTSEKSRYERKRISKEVKERF